MTNSRVGSTKTNSIPPRSIPTASPYPSPRLPNTGRPALPPNEHTAELPNPRCSPDGYASSAGLPVLCAVEDGVDRYRVLVFVDLIDENIWQPRNDPLVGPRNKTRVAEVRKASQTL